VHCRSHERRSKASVAFRLGIDHPIEFVWGETFFTQYPLFTGCETTEKIDPVCVGCDPDTGSNIAVQLTSQKMSDGKQLKPF
jgi:hypothetical protein